MDGEVVFGFFWRSRNPKKQAKLSAAFFKKVGILSLPKKRLPFSLWVWRRNKTYQKNRRRRKIHKVYYSGKNRRRIRGKKIFSNTAIITTFRAIACKVVTKNIFLESKKESCLQSFFLYPGQIPVKFWIHFLHKTTEKWARWYFF